MERKPCVFLASLILVVSAAIATAQTKQPPKSSTEQQKPTAADAVTNTQAAAATPEKIEVTPIANDSEIKERLTKILLATEWFSESEVSLLLDCRPLIYLVVAIVSAGTVPGQELISDYGAMRRISLFPWLVDAVIVCATL